MTRSRAARRAWLALEMLVLIAMMVLVKGSVSRAQSEATRIAETEDERELLELLEDNQLVTARRKVDALLKDDPKSLVGHYVLGRVMHESEGNIPAAMYHLGRARQIYEDTWDVHPRREGAPWQFHRELLYHIQATAQQMEEFEYQLEILAYHDALYAPNLDAQRAWPLIRLGRVKEARKAAREATESSDAYQRKLGLNVRCAVSGELREREDYYEDCLAAFELAKKEDAEAADAAAHSSTLAIHAFNAAVAARAALLPEEAEKIALEGAKRLAFTPANPWRLLVSLYTDQGRMKDAVEALREMQAWRRKQPPNIRAQAHAETDVVFSTVLLVAAQPQTGLRLLDQALDRPDRRGLTSSTPEQALGAHALLRRALAKTQSELEAEQASYDESVSLVGRATRAANRRFEILADEERVISVLTDSDRLVSTLRVFLRGGIEPVPVWLVGDLVDVLGAGIVSVGLHLARDDEQEEDVDAYFDAIEAEVALAQGDETRALELAKRALEDLPKSEVLLKGRVAAVGAQAAWDDGNTKLYLSLLTRAMELDPSVIRRLGMSIPAKIKASSDKRAQLTAEKLESSPRLRTGGGGFLIDIGESEDAIEICLATPDGTRLSCAITPPPAVDDKTGKPKKESTEAYATRAAEAFHAKALAMPLGLSAADLTSLDGSTTVAEQAHREKLDKLLEEQLKDQD